METIITLLIVLLPVVFKLIGKALDNAAAKGVPDVPHRPDVASDMMKDDSVPKRPEYQSLVRRPVAAHVEHQEGESVIARPVEPAPTVQATAEDKPVKKKKIDPKKLIVYSEIMKPKY